MNPPEAFPAPALWAVWRASLMPHIQWTLSAPGYPAVTPFGGPTTETGAFLGSNAIEHPGRYKVQHSWSNPELAPALCAPQPLPPQPPARAWQRRASFPSAIDLLQRWPLLTTAVPVWTASGYSWPCPAPTLLCQRLLPLLLADLSLSVSPVEWRRVWVSSPKTHGFH